MKLRLPALAIVAMLVFVPMAVGKTNKVTGKIRRNPPDSHDAHSRVSMKVVVNKRKRRATRIKGLKFSNVSYQCAGRVFGEKTVNLGSSRIKKVSVPTSAAPRTVYTFHVDKTVAGTNYIVSGTVNRKGTKAKGTLRFSFGTGHSRCVGGGLSSNGQGLPFKAKRK